MDGASPTPVNIDALVRSTTNYATWLEGTAPTSSQIGVHGFEFDAHDQLGAIELDVFHVLVCLQGAAAISRVVGDEVESLHLGPGDVLVNPASVPLRWRWTGAVKVLNVTVRPSYLDDIARESLGCAARLRPRRVPHASDPRLAQYGLELQRELDLPRALGAQRGVRAIGEGVALHLLRNYVSVEQLLHERTFSDEQQQTLRAFIEARLDEPPSVATLAGLVHLGQHHFSRTFRATFGRSPGTWIRELRLERARALLMSTTDSIAAIAMKSGFSDQSHLTRWFARHFGVTPAALRRSRQRASAWPDLRRADSSR